MQIDYVVGFLFSEDKKNVLLVEKIKPLWQKGKLNGVGGKIEKNEFASDAMCREFQEETGIDSLILWQIYAKLYTPGIFSLFVYKAFDDVIWKTNEVNDVGEKLHIRFIPGISWEEPKIFNLNWLIPLALDDSVQEMISVELI